MPGTAGRVDPAVLYVAKQLGLTNSFARTVPRVLLPSLSGLKSFPKALKVLGPASPPVQATQIACQAYGTHTQMLLGPSESMIISDDSADITLLAADLLNEAEHGPD